MAKLLAVLLLALPLGGCMGTTSYPQNPTHPSPQQQDTEQHRDLGA